MVCKLIMCAQYSDNNTAIHTAIIDSDVIKINTRVRLQVSEQMKDREGKIDISRWKIAYHFRRA